MVCQLWHEDRNQIISVLINVCYTYFYLLYLIGYLHILPGLEGYMEHPSINSLVTILSNDLKTVIEWYRIRNITYIFVCLIITLFHNVTCLRFLSFRRNLCTLPLKYLIRGWAITLRKRERMGDTTDAINHLSLRSQITKQYTMVASVVHEDQQ